MSTVSQTSEAMQWVLNEYPSLIEKKTRFVQRSTAQLNGATFVRGLVLGWMAEAEASYSQLRSCIATLGVDVSSQAVEQRFGPESVKLFKEVLNEAIKQVISSEGVVPELFTRFNGVYCQDGSILGLPASMAEPYPGCGGKSPQAGLSSMRLEVRWDLSHGGMKGPWITPGREAEHKGAAREEHLPGGSLFLGDANYFTLTSMRVRGQAGGYWLVPAKATLYFSEVQGISVDLVSYLNKHAHEKVVDGWIEAGQASRLPCRFIAVHLSRAQRRVKARYTVYQPARSKGVQTRGPKGGKLANKPGKSRQKVKKTSKSRLQLAQWVILLTNVPVERLSAEEALVLMRCRWQIELLWKLWKQYGKIDAWRSGNPARIETEIYAKILGLLIQHWMTILGCWQDPQRSLRKAQQVSQWAASALGFALVGEMSLSRAIARITRAMSKGCRIDSRRKKPNTYQLVRNPKLIRS